MHRSCASRDDGVKTSSVGVSAASPDASFVGDASLEPSAETDEERREESGAL
jgi:hypothetical protein